MKTSEERYRVILSMDDTDHLESMGTGELLHRFGRSLEEELGAQVSPITRHQLFFDPRIPYTSHNSAMVVEVRLLKGQINQLMEKGMFYLETHAAKGSDPGLCIAHGPILQEAKALIRYGKRAKVEVLTKESAVALARALGIHLSEHGGTGGGVIGALAGVGLHLSGSDGRIKGKIFEDRSGERLTVSTFLDQGGVDVVQTLEGRVLSGNERIEIDQKVKAIWWQHLITLLVKPHPEKEGLWINLPREEIQKY